MLDVEEDVVASSMRKTGLQLRLDVLPEGSAECPSRGGKCYLVDELHLQEIGASSVCSECGSECRMDVGKQRRSIGGSFTSSCTDCGAQVVTSKPTLIRGFDGIATRLEAGRVKLVYDSLINGLGYAGMSSTCRNLGLDGMGSRQYGTYAHFLYKQVQEMWRRHPEELKHGMEAALVSSGVSPSNDGCLEVDVSYDGTWMTRGYRSHIGVGFVLDATLGFVLDVEVLSNFCQECCKRKKRLSPEDFTAWKATHTRCSKNFDGKSGAMEVEAAVRMWQRSEARGYRYTRFIGDGDSAAYNAVCALNDGAGPYATATVVKEECINHVAKRMGTRLRQLKKDQRVPQKTKAGKTIMRSRLAGKDGLTDADIDRISTHYGQNIRSHQPDDTVELLRKRILAIYYHARSTDEEPHHSSCPVGELSWCWVKRAEAAGETPALHTSKHLYLAGLPQDLLRRILQVFMDLTSPNLLHRCMRNQTQNRNESLHSKLWRKCLKVKFAYLERSVFAATVTTLFHNLGEVRGHVLVALGLIPGQTIEEKKKKEATPAKKTPTQKRKRTSQAEPSTSYAPGRF
jgi:hypothetical protein